MKARKKEKNKNNSHRLGSNSKRPDVYKKVHKDLSHASVPTIDNTVDDEVPPSENEQSIGGGDDIDDETEHEEEEEIDPNSSMPHLDVEEEDHEGNDDGEGDDQEEEDEEENEEENEEEGEEDDDDDEENEEDEDGADEADETEEVEEEECHDVRLKVKCGDEIRSMVVTSNTNYEHFLQILNADYGQIDSITYQDSEGDNIAIRNQHDLSQAFEYYLNNLSDSGKTLRLDITKNIQPKTPPMTSGITITPSTLRANAPGTIVKRTLKPNTLDSRASSASRDPMRKSLMDTMNSTSGIVQPGFIWQKGNLLGKGAFGSVYLGMVQGSGLLMAVKVIELGQLSDPKETENFQRELKLMQSFSHPNIVQYLGCEQSEQDNTLNIFLEYVPGGSLQSLIKRFGTLPENTIRHFTRQILEGLHYLHSNGVVHRDIKGDNILADNQGNAKLADFGCSRQLNELCSKTHGCVTMVGTPYWMAPEVITDDGGYGFKADIWSVGCTVVEMMTGKPPWPEFQSMWAAIYHIANSDGPPDIPDDISEVARDFLNLCFQRDVSKRPSAEELIAHPFCIEDETLSLVVEEAL